MKYLKASSTLLRLGVSVFFFAYVIMMGIDFYKYNDAREEARINKMNRTSISIDLKEMIKEKD